MRKLIYLFVLIIGFNSCGTVNHNRFSYYKLSPKIKESFATNGVYYRFEEFHGVNDDDRYWAHLYFFYRDGTLISTTLSMKSSTDKDVISKLSGEFNKNVERAVGNDGAYIINGDSLKTQMFISTQQRKLYNLDIIEDVFLINKENNSIKLISIFCQWCSKDEMKIFASDIASEEYKYLPLIAKPDSSKLWFRKTKWYKKGLEIK